MTPNEITTLIASSPGINRELDIPFKKQLYERVKAWRSTFLKQTLDKSPGDIRYFRQTLYLPMEKINLLKCGEGLECFAASSVDEVPVPLRVLDAGVFSYVGGIDGQSPFGFADSGVRSYLMSGKYSRTLNYYDFVNRHIVVTKLPSLPVTRVEGVFDSFEDALKYESCDGPNHNCDWWNTDIPMSGDIAQKIIQYILKVDYGQPERTPDDHQVKVNTNSNE